MNTVVDYVVPARRVLTAVHRTDPGRSTHTLCGEEMTPAGLWVPYQYDPARDRLCQGCAGHRPVPIEETPLL